MGIATFDELKSHVENWIDDDQYTSLLDEFIFLCEDRLNKKLRTKEMISRETASLSTSSRYLAHPDDYLSMKRLRLLTSPYKELVQVSPENITRFDSTSPREPHFYTDVDEQIEFECVPNSDHTVEMVFYKKITALSGSNDDNAILLAYPNLYLFGALVEAFQYAFDDERAAYFEQRFQAELKAVNDIEKERMRHSVPLSNNSDMPGVGSNRTRSILSL